MRANLSQRTVLGAIAIVVALNAAPAAAAPSTGPIYACITKAYSTLNLAGPGPSCPAGQRLIGWNLQEGVPAPITGRDIAKSTITPRNLNLPRVRKFFQARLQGRCVDGEALKYVTESGRIKCTALSAGTITGIEAKDGLTGGGTAGTVQVGVDSSVIQQRIAGRCSDNTAFQAVGQDGSAGCSPFQAPFENGGCGGAHDAIRSANPVTGKLDCIPAVAKVTAGTGLTGGGGPGDITINADTTFLQRRVAGTCTGTNAIASIAQDGTVGCQATGTGSVTSVGSGFGLTGGPVTTSGSLAADPTVLQRRVGGTCTTAGNTGVQGVNQDGTVSCGNLQNRVTGTCSSAGNNAVQAIAADGTTTCGNLQSRVTGTCSSTSALQSITAAGGANCSANLTPASRVQAIGPNDIAVGGSVTIVDTGNGLKVEGQCTSGPTAEVHVITTGGGSNVFWNTSAGNGAAGPTTDQAIISSASPEMGTYTAAGLSGPAGGTAVYGQVYSFTGSGQCQFGGDGITT